MALKTKETGKASWRRPGIPPAFRYPNYRAFWLGMLASVNGFQMMQFGQVVLIHQLTGSPLYLGYLGLTAGVPAVVLNLFGGVFADRLDKRRLIVVTQGSTGVVLFLLATLTLLDLVQPWHVLVVAFLVGAVEAFDQAARRALFPHLVERKALMSAVALNSAIWSGTRIVAPAIAGIIIAKFSPEIVFYLAGSGFLVMSGVIYGLRLPRLPQGEHGTPLHDLAEGMMFIKRNSVFSLLIGMTFFNSFFGISFIFLMPIFAFDILNVGAEGQGLLLSVSGIGALLITLWLGSRSNMRAKGLVIVAGAVATGLSIAAFGLTARFLGSYTLALVLMFVVGLASSTYMISIQSSLQMLVPDSMRGRVMGFFGMTWNIFPLGGMQMGLLANFITAPFAVAAGGLAVAVFALGPGFLNRRALSAEAVLGQSEASAAEEAPVSASRADD